MSTLCVCKVSTTNLSVLCIVYTRKKSRPFGLYKQNLELDFLINRVELFANLFRGMASSHLPLLVILIIIFNLA